MKTTPPFINIIESYLNSDVVSVCIKIDYYDGTFGTGSSSGTTWIDRNSQEVRLDFSDSDRRVIWGGIFDFLDASLIEGKSNKDYWNLCTINVSNDGTHSITLEYQPELDEQNEQEIIDSIGQELFDKYQREDNERQRDANSLPGPIDQPNDEKMQTEQESYTLPELIGFISEELSNDVPDDWKETVIDGEVFNEGGKQAVSMVCHYTSQGQTSPQRFTPSNSIGPMNALVKMQKLMAQEGNTWRKIKLTLNSEGSASLQTD